MNRTMRLIAALLVLAGCSSSPTRYERQPWATMGFEEARAKCQHEINTVSGLGGTMYLCLRGKGWYSQ